jgi:uncharacterized protein (TIGR02266 family)
MVEQRRSHRTPLDVPVRFHRKATMEEAPGHARDISVGGVFVETVDPYPFGTEVIVHVQLPGHKEEMALAGLVRWTRADGMGVQFGPIGARETHAITELVNPRA